MVFETALEVSVSLVEDSPLSKRVYFLNTFQHWVYSDSAMLET